MRCRGEVPMRCRGAKNVVPAGAVGAEISLKSGEVWGISHEMLMTSYNLRCRKPPQNSPNTPLFDQKWPLSANRKPSPETGSCAAHAQPKLLFYKTFSLIQMDDNVCAYQISVKSHL